MSAALRYEIVGYDLHAHEFAVRLTVPGPLVRGERLSLPAWIPGSYMIRDFARNIVELRGSGPQGRVRLIKADKQTWVLDEHVDDLRIDYRVYAFDMSVRSAYLDQTRAYFNGPSLFLRVAGRESADWELTIARPADPATAAWRVATTLPVSAVDGAGFGSYSGAGYARLIDHPVEIGVHDDGEFEVAKRPHRVVITDGLGFDMGRLCGDLGRICGEHVALFGELPVERYLFMALATADGYGGLEHCDCTSLVCKRSDLPRPGALGIGKGYRQFLALCSHEYFHLWNVKRIRPAAFAAPDLSAEVHTELLWAFEGITSYYDELALARCGVLGAQSYLDLFATTVSRVLRTPGRLRQSIAESSFDAWTKFYKQDENSPNAIVSYYAKGALVAFGLDVVMRERSGGSVSLDDLMRRLWERHGKTGVGVPERAIERDVGELLGEPVDGFFADYVYGTAELPLAEWFAKVGVGCRVRAAAGPDDLGGYRAGGHDETEGVDLGARFEPQPGGLRLTQVVSGGAAQCAGLAPGDTLIALADERVTAANLNDLLARLGTETQAHFFRRDRLLSTRLPLGPARADTCDLWLLDQAEAGQAALRMRDAWLASNVAVSSRVADAEA